MGIRIPPDPPNKTSRDTTEFLLSGNIIPPSVTISGQIPARKNPVRKKEIKIPAALLLYIPKITEIVVRNVMDIKTLKIPNFFENKPVNILPTMTANQKKETTWPAEISVKDLSVRKKVGIQLLSAISVHEQKNNAITSKVNTVLLSNLIDLKILGVILISGLSYWEISDNAKSIIFKKHIIPAAIYVFFQ